MSKQSETARSGASAICFTPATVDSLRRAIEDLRTSFGDRYPDGGSFLRRLDQLAERALAGGDEAWLKEALAALQRESLLANPLIDFDQLLLVRRREIPNQQFHNGHVPDPFGLPQNWQSNSSLRKNVWDNAIEILSRPRAGGPTTRRDAFQTLTTIYKSTGNLFVGDVDLHFDADTMLFSSLGTNGCWQVFEIHVDGTGLRQVTPGLDVDVDSYDACYLPDGRIVFASTASMQSVPCVNGKARVANLYLMNADGQSIRQLCFDQDDNWCPTVLNDGRVLYARWEYTDLPHFASRLLFHMNPDGTGQMEYYGSNSYWPNAMFYARPVPGHNTKVVAVVSGHHGSRRAGELVIFDPAQGRCEADGAVQRIPGFGQRVEPVLVDKLADDSWPKFLHPFPLSEKYLLVSAKPTPDSEWGIYLVDVFDNMTLIREEPGFGLFEPIPLRETPRPPVIADKVDLDRKDAVVHLIDVYAGRGLEGIPRGAVKQLRLFTYVYGYPSLAEHQLGDAEKSQQHPCNDPTHPSLGGNTGVIGMDGPWDVKRIMGTVPVESDGSAMFRVPANLPISVQPLDAEGKALALMRSWLTAMPGETVSCAGCHEPQSAVPPIVQTLASHRGPTEIEPWRGPTRGFSFNHEVQPVLDRYCVACHNGSQQLDGETMLDLRGSKMYDRHRKGVKLRAPYAKVFSQSYVELQQYVRRPGQESDLHLLTPMEYHADTTELVQILAKGHHNVELDAEAWDRLITWIDLNAPYHGSWASIVGDDVAEVAARRVELRKRYGGVDVNTEQVGHTPRGKSTPTRPKPVARTPSPVPKVGGWPFDAAEAKRRQLAAARHERTIDLGNGVRMELVLIPAGDFVMGDVDGELDEQPLARVKIKRPFWMGKCEVTNRQYRRFDESHDSRVESQHATIWPGRLDYSADSPDQPVVRVSWNDAVDFCRWLSRKTGLQCSLPTESQWEYACRAGTNTPFFFGDRDVDFSDFANLGDVTLNQFATANTSDRIPKDDRFNDDGLVSVKVGTYRPNPWGLQDMHGNASEWTRSVFQPYPYRETDGRDDLAAKGHRVVRGGSWYDRPKRCRSAYRSAYRPYQHVYNVGFRVVIQAQPDSLVKN